MKGKRSAKQFYQRLSFVHRFHYQCSEMSSAKEIEGVYKSAIDRQNRLVKAGILDEICCVFLDEAGMQRNLYPHIILIFLKKVYLMR